MEVVWILANSSQDVKRSSVLDEERFVGRNGA